jgi:putative ABC transport system permease protein
MFSIDFWQEILHTIKTNKLRTGLTGFSVAWGIFILIILLGAGIGIQNGIKDQFSRGAVNSIWVIPFQTSRPYKGLPEGRPIIFHNDDYDGLKKFKEIEAITGRYDEENMFNGGKSVMNYKDNYGVFEMCSCHPGQAIADQIIMDQGRFVNQIDIDQIRKTAAITTVVKDALFKNEDALGKYFTVKGVPFKVVGVFRDASAENSRRIYIPITTRQRVFNGGNRIRYFGMTLINMTVKEIEQTMTKIREYFGQKYKFDPQDMRAVFINDNFKRYKQFMDLFSTISIVVWAVGIMTIIAGIMGVSNIMVIAVKERTHEIGIRKALGATPGSVVTLVISEAILITGIAGFFGMSLGVFLLDFSAKHLPAFDYFKNPEVNIWVILSATAVIVISGGLAGMVPALHAAKIRPIVALRDE